MDQEQGNPVTIVRPASYTIQTSHGAMVLMDNLGTFILNFYVDVPSTESLQTDNFSKGIERRELCGIAMNWPLLNTLHAQLGEVIARNKDKFPPLEQPAS